MKKVFIAIFLSLLVLTSCSVSEKRAPVTLSDASAPIMISDATFSKSSSLLSGESSSVPTKHITIGNFDVVVPIFNNDEIDNLLKFRLEEFTLSSENTADSGSVDFDYNEWNGIESFVFYFSDSISSVQNHKLFFSYDKIRNKEKLLYDIVDSKTLGELIYEKYSVENVVPEAFTVKNDTLVVYSNNTQYVIDGERIINLSNYRVFNPNDYKPVTDKNEKVIALTFDDGPNPYTTPGLLKTLEEKGVKATFFMVGYNVDAYSNVVKSVYEKGHDIGIHSWRHSNFYLMKPEEVIADLDRSSDLIYSIIKKRPYLVRPPFGNIYIDDIDAEKYFFVNWNVDPADWNDRTAEEIAKHVVSHAFSGAIILLHDIFQTSCDATVEIIDKLTEQGYRFVTLSELFDLHEKSSDGKLHFFMEDFNAE